jgi:hypothetical protein
MSAWSLFPGVKRLDHGTENPPLCVCLAFNGTALPFQVFICLTKQYAMKMPSHTFTLLVQPIITLISSQTIMHSSVQYTGWPWSGQPGFNSRQGWRHFSLQNCVHPASWPVGNKSLLATLEWLGCKADWSAMSGIQVENAWDSTFSGRYIFMHCLVQQADNITFFQDKIVIWCD